MRGGGEKKVIFSFLCILGVPQNMIHFGILIVWIQSKYCDDCFMDQCVIHRGSYMSAHVLLNLLKELRKRDKM